jgi:hypothetical protein
MRFSEMMLDWCDWAAAIVADWPEEIREAELDRDALEKLIGRKGPSRRRVAG